MTVKNSDGVISAFSVGDDKRYKTSNNSLSSNDKKLYSYRLLISFWVDGIITIYNHTAKGGHFISSTTSNHVYKLVGYLEDNDIEFNLIEALYD